MVGNPNKWITDFRAQQDGTTSCANYGRPTQAIGLRMIINNESEDVSTL